MEAPCVSRSEDVCFCDVASLKRYSKLKSAEFFDIEIVAHTALFSIHQELIAHKTDVPLKYNYCRITRRYQNGSFDSVC